MENKILKSITNNEIKFLRKLLKNNREENFFVIENYHLVYEALKTNLIEEIYEIENKNEFPNSIKIASSLFHRISNLVNPEGVLALCKKPKNNVIGKKIVFLDNVQDPGNIGTILRNTIAFNFDSVFTNVNIFNDKIVRSSQGAIFKVNVNKINNSYKDLHNLKLKGYKIYLTSLEKNSLNFNLLPYKKGEKVVLVLGNEGQGVSKELYELADEKIYIPIKFESLNVAVASGIFLNYFYTKELENEK
ncbi:TrmH family RNA methyltransferase [Mycoplasmopsis meleagridis]|uniref:TrmH family RNA methyltransferase n=1 Tax=Mycoplasmopsis meleagridis TaxID=29561 RepID=UPI003A858C29